MKAVILLVQLLATAVALAAIHGWTSRRPPSRWTWGLLALGGVAFGIFSFRVSFPSVPFYDYLIAYHPAGRAVLERDPEALRTLTGQGVSGFVNLPVVAYLFAPLALLDPTFAASLFTLAGVGLMVGAWVLLVRLAGLAPRERLVLAVLFLANGPLMNGLKFGNTSYFILCALAGGLALLRSGRPALAGALLGAAAVVKPALALFGVFFVLRRDLRATLGFAAVGAVSVLLSLTLFGWSDNLHWFEKCILQFSRGWAAAFTVQSIPAFIYRLDAGPDVLIDWLSHSPTAGQQLAARLVTGALYLAAAIAWLRGRPVVRPDRNETASRRRDIQYLLVLCLCIVASPLSWSHYYVWLLMPAAFFLGSPAWLPSSMLTRSVAWLAIALTTPLVLEPFTLANPRLKFLYQALFASHLLFGGLLWFGLVAWWLARSGQAASGALSTPEGA